MKTICSWNRVSNNKKRKKYFDFQNLFQDERVLFLIMEYSTHQEMGKWVQVCTQFYKFVKQYMNEFFLFREKDLNLHFIVSCCKGNLKSIQYCVSKGVNIHTHKDLSVEKACLYGHLDVVRYLLENHSTYSKQYPYDNQLLTHLLRIATKTKNLPLVEYLILKNENINDNARPLLDCCENGDLNMVQLIIEKGIKMDQMDVHPIYIACSYGHLELVQYFISQGVDFRMDHGHLLRLACNMNHLHIVKYLISQGAIFHAGFSLDFVKCLKKGYLSMAKYMIEQGLILICDTDKIATLCCKNGYLELVQHLVSHSQINLSNLCWIRLACENGHLEMAEYLVSQGLDFYKNDSIRIQLYFMKRHLEMVRYLVSQGFDVYQNLEQNLMDACKNGHLECVKYLISIGVDLNNQDSIFLRCACSHQRLDVVQYLLLKGAIFPSKQVYIKELMEQANDNIICLLASHDSNFGPYFFSTSWKMGYLDNVKFLFSKIDHNLKYETLKMAMENNDFQMANDFISQGLTTHKENEKMFKTAIQTQNKPMVQFLLDQGVNIHMEDEIALKMAFATNNHDLIFYLIQQGATPNDNMIEYIKGVSTLNHRNTTSFLSKMSSFCLLM